MTPGFYTRDLLAVRTFTWRRPERTRAASPWRRGLLAVILITALAGCAKTDRPRQVPYGERHPLILFAVDGLEWRVMTPLLAQGRLPTFAALMEQGTFGYIESMIPTLSPVIWTSIATGKIPERHGIHSFVYEEKTDDGRTEYHYFTSGHRRTKAIWNILSDYGLVVDCIGWWMTYPAEPINGVMVSQTNTVSVLRDQKRAIWKGTLLKGVEGQVYPPELQNRVMERLADVDRSLDNLTEEIFGRLLHPMTPFSRLMWDHTLWAFRADATYLAVALDLLETQEPFDLMAIYIGGADVASHRFWQYAYPREFMYPPSREQIENFSGLIDDYYGYIDRKIGEILRASPENTTAIIVSDHGMHAINTDRQFSVDDPFPETISGHHVDGPPGVFIATGPHIQKTPQARGSQIGSNAGALRIIGGILDIAPTLLVLKGVPVGEDMDGEVLAQIVRPEWLKQAPMRRVKTHDDPKWLAAHRARIREAVDHAERLEQLRSLGYIR